MSRPVWEQLDPLAFNDGVFYVSAGIELQPRLNLWGLPEQPDLRERLANDRPHGIGGKKLLCLLCMRHRIQNNLPRIPVWLTFVEGRHGPMFRHEDGRSPHPEHEPETDTHKALKERKARTWESVGGTVEVEVWRPRARRRPDFLAIGPDLTVAGETQHSKARIVTALGGCWATPRYGRRAHAARSASPILYSNAIPPPRRSMMISPSVVVDLEA